MLPLTAPAQLKPTATLQKVEVNSAPIKMNGPFHEGATTVGRRTEIQESSEEDLSAGRSTRLGQVPTIRSSDKGAIKTVATVAKAGRSAVAAGAAEKSGSTQVMDAARPQNSFGESMFMPRPGFRSPEPTTVWPDGAEANGNGVIDPQIAVSSNMVAVLTWGKLAFYYKSGTRVPETATFQNPVLLSAIFANAVAEMDKHLNLNSGLKGWDISSFLLANGGIGDARIAFDVFRRRWVIAGTAKNGPDTDKFSQLICLSQRRTKIIFAVSKDEDPMKGFFTYHFNGSPDDGACGAYSDDAVCPGTAFTPGNAADYPSLGISPHHYLVTLHVDHEPLDGSSGQPLWGYLVTINADDAANGKSNPHAHAFWGWELAGGGHAKGVTMPVIEHDSLTPTPWGLIASNNVDKFVITLVSPQDPPTLSSIAFDMPDMEKATDWLQKGSARLVQYGNVGNQTITAHSVGNKLFVAFNDCRTWVDSQSDCSPSIHLFSVQVGLPLAATGIDRVIGWRNVYDDKPDDVVAYGMPGIAVNRDGDLVVVYSRTSKQMFPEVRYSTWLHNELDLRPSRLLRAGDGPIPKNFLDCAPPKTCKVLKTDTAGVAVDPFDHTSIWMAHLFADSSGKWSVAVGKVFGNKHPDLLVSKLTLSPATLKAGAHLTINYKIANVGDGLAEAVRVKASLVPITLKGRIDLGEDTPAVIGSGKSTNRSFTVTLPSKLTAGTYNLVVTGAVRPEQTEYNLADNNVRSPLQVTP